MPKYKDEEEYLADDQHEALISEALFYKVQAILDGRKNYATSVEAPNQLPFRGFLDCPKCTRKLTGSGSRSRNGELHYYYHCQSSCGTRFKADEVNEYLMKQLKKLSIMKGNVEFYTAIILKAYADAKGTEKDARQSILNEIREQQARISKAMDLMLKEQIDPADYRKVKSRSRKKPDGLRSSIAAYRTIYAGIGCYSKRSDVKHG